MDHSARTSTQAELSEAVEIDTKMEFLKKWLIVAHCLTLRHIGATWCQLCATFSGSKWRQCVNFGSGRGVFVFYFFISITKTPRPNRTNFFYFLVRFSQN
jgi:hypothetical protein